jgi:hypothetical protein
MQGRSGGEVGEGREEGENASWDMSQMDQGRYINELLRGRGLEGRGGGGGVGAYIFDGAKRGEKNKSLKLNKAETKAGSMELRDRGSQAHAVDIVFMATSWSAALRTASAAV